MERHTPAFQSKNSVPNKHRVSKNLRINSLLFSRLFYVAASRNNSPLIRSLANFVNNVNLD